MAAAGVPQSRHSSSQTARLHQDEPLLCPIGSDSADCAVRLCSAGEYKSGRSCYVCSAGRYQSDNNHEHTSCRSCPAGKEDSSSRTGCSWCAVGTYDRSDRTSCNSCPSGQTSDQGSDSIADCMSMTCEQGEYVSGASCLSCPVGQYQTSVSTGKPHDFERSERAAARKSDRASLVPAGLCPAGSDSADCGGCRWTNDGECVSAAPSDANRSAATHRVRPGRVECRTNPAAPACARTTPTSRTARFAPGPTMAGVTSRAAPASARQALTPRTATLVCGETTATATRSRACALPDPTPTTARVIDRHASGPTTASVTNTRGCARSDPTPTTARVPAAPAPGRTTASV